MKIIDLHCDVLFKLWKSKGTLRFINSPELKANKERLKEGKVKIQCFAIFIPPVIKVEDRFQMALDQIEYFKDEVLAKNSDMKQVKCLSDFQQLKEEEIGAMLTLEGVDCIGNDLQKLQILIDLGVRSVGLTWNYANLAADGILEPRGAGLTSFGKEIVRFNNKQNIFTDVSHLSERAFWDVIDLADYPIASHSNAKEICTHPRNLSDDQVKALFSKNGTIHIVYYPKFVAKKQNVTIMDLIKHIDHFCSLGGIRQVGLGSDFDGITTYIKGLENASKHQNLINELLKYYSEEQVRGFAGQNFLEQWPA